MLAVGLTRSREAAKGNAVVSGRRAADGSRRVFRFVARAFQPEICPLRLVRLVRLVIVAEGGRLAGCWSHAKPRSREAAKGIAVGWDSGVG